MKLVILDRDGVINEDSDDYVKSTDEFIMLPGSAEAIARLNHAGYRVAVATNQSGIARGFFDLETLGQMHAKLQKEVANAGGHIDLIVYCPHGPEDQCDCRKPLPGMLQEIGSRLCASLASVPVVGDSLRDLQAAQEVGAQPILVRTGKGKRTLAKGEGLDGIPVYDSLTDAVDALVQEA